MPKPPNVPDNLPPPITLTCSRSAKPILRVKNGRPLFAERSKPLEKPRPPNSNAAASCKEEVTRFRKEQRKAGSVDLTSIQGCIGKIGIEGKRAGEAWGDTIEGVAAGSETNAGILTWNMPVRA